VFQSVELGEEKKNIKISLKKKSKKKERRGRYDCNFENN